MTFTPLIGAGSISTTSAKLIVGSFGVLQKLHACNVESMVAFIALQLASGRAQFSPGQHVPRGCTSGSSVRELQNTLALLEEPESRWGNARSDIYIRLSSSTSVPRAQEILQAALHKDP